MALSSTRFPSKSGISIPAIGLGTMEAQENVGDKGVQAVVAALKAGYRHIDTAALYGSEEDVGKGIRLSGVPREKVFVCTKFWNTEHAPGDVEKSLDESLKRLGLDYVDAYLMHFPIAFKKTADGQPAIDSNGKPIVDDSLTANPTPTWRAMESLVRSGKARSIGVSNFNITRLRKLLAHADIKPCCNQVEAHPYLPQKELLRFCKENGIVFVAYSPLGTQTGPRMWHTVERRLLEDEEVVEVAKRIGKQPAQVVLAWAVQRGTAAVPKSATPERIRNNLDLPTLSEEDFKTIDEMSERHPEKAKRIVDFSEMWGLPTSLYDESG